jgi:hypothetical protein
MVESRSVACDGCSLAREAAGEKIDARRAAIHLSHVPVDRHSGPSQRQDLSTLWLGLAEESVLPPSEGEAEVEEAVA